MVCYYCLVWAAHDEYAAFFQCPGDYSYFTFNGHISVLCIGIESAACKYNTLRPSWWGMCNASIIAQAHTFLLQSEAMQVTLLVSKVVTPFLTKPTMIYLDWWNAFSRFPFQTKCVLYLTRSWNGSILGLNEYDQLLGWLAQTKILYQKYFGGLGSWKLHLVNW